MTFLDVIVRNKGQYLQTEEKQLSTAGATLSPPKTAPSLSNSGICNKSNQVYLYTAYFDTVQGCLQCTKQCMLK